MKDFSDIISVTDENGEFVNLTAPDDTINVHLRPGYIVPIQNNKIEE
jgi:alpha-glucosidase (family GH31 glycosyl hydrolase)